MAENITATRVGGEAIRSSRQMELVRLTGTAAATATGSIIFDDNPTDGDTLTLNGTTLAFLDTPVDPTIDVEIGADAAETLANLLALLDASVIAEIAEAEYTSNETDTLTITYGTAGAGGNDYTLATDSDALALSGATLTGGVTATAAGDTAAAYISSFRPSFCVGAAVVTVTGNSVVFKSLTALAGDQAVVRLYS